MLRLRSVAPCYCKYFCWLQTFLYKFSTAKYERIASPTKPDKITTVKFNVFNLSLKLL